MGLGGLTPFVRW